MKPLTLHWRASLPAYILFTAVFFISLKVFPQGTLFRNDDIIEIELRSDFSAIQIERTVEAKSHDGELIYSIPGSNKTNLRVKLESRGFFRRDPAHCSFPPLLVNFRKKDVHGTLFEDQDKLKMVTPCQSDNDVLDEYLVYKLFNIITEKSLKVRLARVLYFDTRQNKKLFRGYSFFIENEDKASERLSAAETKKYITPFDLDTDAYIKLVLFQYMIGNKDWYATSRKNIIIMQPSDSALRPFAVPYDFDLSGFVNAGYSIPAGAAPDQLQDKHVYKGLSFSDDEFNRAFDYFEVLKGKFTETIMNMTLLSKRNRNEDKFYLDEFYRFIKDRESAVMDFRKNSETRKLYNLPE